MKGSSQYHRCRQEAGCHSRPGGCSREGGLPDHQVIVCSAESHSGTARDGTAEQSCDSGPGEEGCSDGSEEGPPNGRDRNLEPGGVCRADCGEHEHTKI